MKAYIVTRGAYSDYHIVGVYSTQEIAERYRNLEPGDTADIEIWDVDVLYDPVEHGYKFWSVDFDKAGNIVYLSQEDMEIGDGEIERNSYYLHQRGITFHLYAKDRDHAIKIASEQRFMILANGIEYVNSRDCVDLGEFKPEEDTNERLRI